MSQISQEEAAELYKRIEKLEKRVVRCELKIEILTRKFVSGNRSPA